MLTTCDVCRDHLWIYCKYDNTPDPPEGWWPVQRCDVCLALTDDFQAAHRAVADTFGRANPRSAEIRYRVDQDGFLAGDVLVRFATD